VPKGFQSEIMRGSHIEFVCSVWTFNLHTINRLLLYNEGAECLQCGTD